MEFAAESSAARVLALWITAAGMAVTSLTAALAGLITPWLLVLTGIGIFLTIVASQWYPPRYAAAFHGRFDGSSIYASRGVFWKKELYIPTHALRTVELCSTPLQRRLRCITLVLHYAGGTAILPLLPEEQAKALAGAIDRFDDE